MTRGRADEEATGETWLWSETWIFPWKWVCLFWSNYNLIPGILSEENGFKRTSLFSEAVGFIGFLVL